MKGSIVLVIGGVVVVGAAAYVIYKHLKSQTEDQAEKVTAPFPKDEPTVTSTDFSQVKEDAATTIKDRHSEAAQVINESLQTIFDRENAEEVITENSESLDKIDDDLDNLLK